MASQACIDAGAPATFDHKDTGANETIDGGLRCYITGDAAAARAPVMLISDIFGIDFPQVREFADRVAAAGAQGGDVIGAMPVIQCMGGLSRSLSHIPDLRNRWRTAPQLLGSMRIDCRARRWTCQGYSRQRTSQGQGRGAQKEVSVRRIGHAVLFAKCVVRHVHEDSPDYECDYGLYSAGSCGTRAVVAFTKGYCIALLLCTFVFHEYELVPPSMTLGCCTIIITQKLNNIYRLLRGRAGLFRWPAADV